MNPPQAAVSDSAELDALRRLTALRYDDGVGNVHASNGANKLTNPLLTIMSLLVVAGICGEVALYGEVKALQSTMDLIVAGKIIIVHVP